MTRGEMDEHIRAFVAAVGSQRGAAKRLGVSDPYLSDVLRGKRDPGPKMLNKLGFRRVAVYERISERGK